MIDSTRRPRATTPAPVTGPDGYQYVNGQRPGDYLRATAKREFGRNGLAMLEAVAVDAHADSLLETLRRF